MFIALCSLIGLALQSFVFQLIDPFGYPDTIRYLNFAQFLSAPSVAHFGDYAHHHGIVFVPFFLPIWLLTVKHILGFSYEVVGLILQVISVQITLWFTYLIALKTAGKRAAQIAVLFLIAHFGFFVLSGFVTSEYSFTALVMTITYFAVQWDLRHIKKLAILSLLMTALVSMRSQGLAFSFLIVGYLVYSKKLRIHQGLLLLMPPLAYSLCYNRFFYFLDYQFPKTLSLNDSVTQSIFVLGDRFGDYDFQVHGARAISAKETAIGLLLDQPSEYAAHLIKRIQEFCIFFNKGFSFYYALAIAIVLSSVRTKIKAKPIFIIWIYGNFFATFFLLSFPETIARYQFSSFPFAIILISSALTSALPNNLNFRKMQIQSTLVLGLILVSYAYYYYGEHKDFYVRWKSGSYVENLTLKEGVIRSAQIIQKLTGNQSVKIATMSTYDYGPIYRSKNIPVYFNWNWNQEEILDYLKTRDIHYFMGLKKELQILNQKGITYKILTPLTKRKYPQNQEFLCRLDIN